MSNDSISPFRYPGGKSRVAQVLVDKMSADLDKASSFSDMFVGGGSVALAVAARYPNIDIFLNDADKKMYCFWETVISCDGSFEKLLEHIRTHDVDFETFYMCQDLAIGPKSLMGFAAIFLNRTAFSGIMTSGPIGGVHQDGKYDIGCRFNPEATIRKISACRALLLDRTVVTDYKVEQVDPESLATSVCYFDPPYVAKGKSLYTETVDHVKLAKVIGSMNSPWLLSYDNDPLVHELYDGWTTQEPLDHRHTIKGKGRDGWENAGSKELLISRK